MLHISRIRCGRSPSPCLSSLFTSVVRSDGVVGDFEETTHLVYLAAVFKETMRLKNTVPFLSFWAKVTIQSDTAKDWVHGRGAGLSVRVVVADG